LIYLLFVCYCILFCWLITRISFLSKSGLSKKILIALFVLRILSLIVGCYFNIYVLKVSDSIGYQKMGIEEFHLLFQNPHQYFVNIFHTDYPSGYSRFLDDSKSFWNNLRSILIAKMLSIFDLFSFTNFWINTLFFNFLVFFGNVALYRVFIRVFPKFILQLIILIFLFPSALFFSSMIQRDGLIFLSLSMLLYHFFFIFRYKQFSLKRALIIFFFLLCILLLRNFVFIVLIPALIAWFLAEKYPQKAFLSFLIVYAFSTILFFSSGLISSRANLPEYVSLRQQSFIELGKIASSTIAIDSLHPTWKSFLSNAPQAFNHVLLRPYFTEIESFQYFPFATETLFIEILVLLFVFYSKRNVAVNPVIYFCIFFSLTMLLVTGYTVPILGAIVRYRSIYLVLLLIPIVCYTNWSKITETLSFKKERHEVK
jgi:hypothetical protein